MFRCCTTSGGRTRGTCAPDKTRARTPRSQTKPDNQTPWLFSFPLNSNLNFTWASNNNNFDWCPSGSPIKRSKHRWSLCRSSLWSCPCHYGDYKIIWLYNGGLCYCSCHNSGARLRTTQMTISAKAIIFAFAASHLHITHRDRIYHMHQLYQIVISSKVLKHKMLQLGCNPWVLLEFPKECNERQTGEFFWTDIFKPLQTFHIWFLDVNFV